MKNDLREYNKEDILKQDLIIIAGPTAVGKTDISINLAKEINGEIIAIESVGHSYSGEIIEIKQEIAISLGCARMECI